MEIRELHQSTISLAEADELARLRTMRDPRRLRSDPPVSRQMAISDLFVSVPTYALTYWGMFVDARMVGYGEATGALNAANADVAAVGIFVDSSHVDQSIHRSLFDHIVAFELGRGRTRFWGWGDIADDATRSFWEDELGYSLAQDERISRCTIANIDQAMLQKWIDRATQRASGYQLVRAESPLSDEHLGYFAQGLESMNDAPMDDLVHEPDRFDAERAREIEQLVMSTNSEFRTIFAIETSTGELAGYTATRVPRLEPALGKQSDTVTIASHRNKGIGRWLKADMIHWLLDTRPDVRSLDTGNAESNKAMLAINEAMGFRDVMHHGVWHKPDDAALPAAATD